MKKKDIILTCLLTASLTANIYQYNTAQTTATNNETTLTEIQNEVETLTNQNNNLENEIKQLKTTNENLTKETAEFTSKIEQLSDELSGELSNETTATGNLADETTATGNLGGSAGVNNFDMTDVLNAVKDSGAGDQVDVEYALDLEQAALEEQRKQEQAPVEGTVGSDIGSGNGSGTQTGTPSNGNGTGTSSQTPAQNPQPQTPSSSGNGSSSGNQTQAPVSALSGNVNLTQEQKDFINKETAEGENKYAGENKFNSKDKAEDSFMTDVKEWNSQVGGWEGTDSIGEKGFLMPDGGFIDYDVAKALGLV